MALECTGEVRRQSSFSSLHVQQVRALALCLTRHQERPDGTGRGTSSREPIPLLPSGPLEVVLQYVPWPVRWQEDSLSRPKDSEVAEDGRVFRVLEKVIYGVGSFSAQAVTTTTAVFGRVSRWTLSLPKAYSTGDSIAIGLCATTKRGPDWPVAWMPLYGRSQTRENPVNRHPGHKPLRFHEGDELVVEADLRDETAASRETFQFPHAGVARLFHFGPCPSGHRTEPAALVLALPICESCVMPDAPPLRLAVALTYFKLTVRLESYEVY